MKVRLLQQGGGLATFTPIIETAPVTAASSKTESKSEGTKSVMDDEIFKELLTKGGLVNDLNSLIDKIYKMESTSSTPYLNKYNRYTTLKLIGSINTLKQNKELWEQSVKQASDLGGLGEVAVGTSGEVYTKDKTGKVKALSLKEYRDTGAPLLTVSELMKERQYNPQLANQNQIFSVANNAVGIDKIKDDITKAISSLGFESSTSETVHSKEWAQQRASMIQQSGRKPTAAEQESLDTLKQLIESPDTQINVTMSSKTQRNHIDKAINYIWSTLGANKQQKLKAVAAINGVDPLSLITDMALSQTSYESTTKYSTSTPKGATDKAKAAAEKEGAISSFELLHLGKTGKTNFAWNDPSTNKTFNLTATGTGVLTNPDGKSIGWNTLGNILSGYTGQLTKNDQVYFGDKKVDASDLQKIVYDNGEAARVYMPTTADGAPNYAELQRIQSLEQEVSKHPEWSAQVINDFYHERGLTYINVDGNKQYVENDRFKPFLVMSGYTTDESGAAKGNAKVKALNGTEEDAVKDQLEKVWKDNKLDSPTGWLYTTYYKGLVAVPYRKNSALTTLSIGKSLTAPKTSYTHAASKMAMGEASVINASKDILGL